MMNDMPHANPEERREFNRRYRDEHREELNAYSREWRRRKYAEDAEYRAKVQAHARSIPNAITNCRAATHRAIKRGELIRPDACEECGRVGTVEAAHYSYAEPLNVRWLCRQCHRAWDRDEPKGGFTGTKSFGYARGERRPEAKLTEDQVRMIRSSPHRTAVSLATELGVSNGCVESVRYGKSWRHVL